jgi:hypothetical protein
MMQVWLLLIQHFNSHKRKIAPEDLVFKTYEQCHTQPGSTSQDFSQFEVQSVDALRSLTVTPLSADFSTTRSYENSGVDFESPITSPPYRSPEFNSVPNTLISQRSESPYQPMFPVPNANYYNYHYPFNRDSEDYRSHHAAEGQFDTPSDSTYGNSTNNYGSWYDSRHSRTQSMPATTNLAYEYGYERPTRSSSGHFSYHNDSSSKGYEEPNTRRAAMAPFTLPPLDFNKPAYEHDSH